MKILDIIAISFRNLFRQKARTMLTIISVMVGAFLISIMLSVGNGLEKFMISQVTMLSNTRTIGVQKSYDMGSIGFGMGGIQEYEEEPAPDVTESQSDIPTEDQADASAIPNPVEEAMLDRSDLEKISEVDNIEDIAFEAVVSPDYVRIEDEDSKKLGVTLYGMPINLRDGLSFSVVDKDLLESDDSIILSEGYAEEWGVDSSDLLGEKAYVRMSQTGSLSFGMGSGFSGSTQGKEVPTEEFELTIAGFIEKSLLSQMGFVTSEKANELNAYATGKPLDEYEQDEKAFEIIVIVNSDENVDTVDKAIEDLGYQSMTYDETLGQIGVVFNVINAVLSSFGIIAMLVASIGIINTLLMAIYERTREIGVMKAVGSPRYVIGVLFTAEAAWLGFWGGMFGLFTSWLLGRIVNAILHNGIGIGGFTLVKGYLEDYPTFDISVFSVGMVLTVVAITTGVAVVAGLYPSWRASRLDPIDALRHD